jgi:hypothetical protein
MMTDAQAQWRIIEDRWNANTYVEHEEYEFERTDTKLFMYFHASLERCILFVQGAHVWLDKVSTFEGTIVKLIADHAGVEVLVHTNNTDVCKNELKELYCTLSSCV